VVEVVTSQTGFYGGKSSNSRTGDRGHVTELVIDERTLYSTTNNLISSWDMVVQCV
jgi:hypothetical protein